MQNASRPRGKARSKQKARSPKQVTANRSSKNRRGNPKQRQVPVVTLSRCALDYAKARLDPFAAVVTGAQPCIPDLMDLPSFKTATLMRGVFSTGTLGFGCIMVAGFANTSGAFKVWHTEPNYGALLTPTTSSTTGVTGVLDTRYPFTSNQISARNVSIALRVRYVGTQLNLGGRMVMRAENGIQSLFQNGVSFPTASGLPDSIVAPVSRSWHTVGWNPVFPEAFEYENTSYALGSSASANARLACLVAAPDASIPSLFEWEVVQFYECITGPGGTAVPHTTKSHSDPVGYGIVRDFLSSETISELGNSAYNRFMHFAMNGAAAAATSYLSMRTRGPTNPTIEWV